MPGPLFSNEVQAGEPYILGETRLIPFIRSLRINFRGGRSLVFWSRPASMLVVSPDGTEQVFPVPDLTRRIQWGLFAAGLAGAAFIWLFGRRRNVPDQLMKKGV
jgi:hypothetical protein